MRLIGFIGIFLLTAIVAILAVIGFQERQWEAALFVPLMLAFLAFCARTLWLGRRGQGPGGLDAGGSDWGRQTVSHFLRYQVARSPEGLILLVGSGVSLLLAILTFTLPAMPGILPDRAGKATAIFALWPVLGFLYYIKICGPAFNSSIANMVQVFVIMCVPLFLVWS